MLQALANKQIEFAIDQQEFLQGYLAVIFMANYLRYGLLPASNPVLTGPAFVTSEDAQPVAIPLHPRSNIFRIPVDYSEI
ncbi:MAG: hypothetical protein WB586_21795 [Chthoniobacterales bacterium]